MKVSSLDTITLPPLAVTVPIVIVVLLALSLVSYWAGVPILSWIFGVLAVLFPIGATLFVWRMQNRIDNMRGWAPEPASANSELKELKALVGDPFKESAKLGSKFEAARQSAIRGQQAARNRSW